MKVTKLNSSVDKYIGILHIADIHVRLTKRHDEYDSVFSKLYEDVKKLPENVCVTILGDVFHSKSDLSPECVNTVKDLLKNLADLRPTILIPGNHDATLSNKNRLDSLTPIVSALNHKNLSYLRDSGIYLFGNILFNHMSVLESQDNYVSYKDIPQKYKLDYEHKICLFHGPVDQALTDVGYTVSNRSVTLDLFTGHDIVLLGDIHKYQKLQFAPVEMTRQVWENEVDKSEYTHISDIDESSVLVRKNCPETVYCGSLIQQNHGESLDKHGYVIWNLKTQSHKHVNIPNDFGFFTVDIKRGDLSTDISNLPKRTRLRVKCFETVASEVKSVLNILKDKTDLIETTFVRVEDEGIQSNKPSVSNDLKLSDLTSKEYQLSLIKKFITNKFPSDATEERLNEVVKLHEKYGSLIDSDKCVKNIRWKPKKFTFSNMFSYGEDNVLDFTKLKDVVGIFANNASGKSSILSALCFCIFDKCDRTFKASHVLNSQKMSFTCTFNFEINGIDYYIKRTGKSDKKRNVKVDVEFWKVEDGKTIQLNGEARRSTNDLIRDYLGSYDDFILTVLSIQNNKSGTFVDMGHTERKDLLAQFMGLNIFDELYLHSDKSLKESEMTLKLLSKEDIDTSDTKLKIENTSESIYSIESEINVIVDEKTNLEKEVIELSKQYVKIEPKFNRDLSDLESEKTDIVSKINDVRHKITEVDEKILSLSAASSSYTSDLVNESIVDKFNEFKSLSLKFDETKHNLEKKKILITSKIDKIKKLENHRYDPNCKFCVENEFVKDAHKTKDSLESDKKEIQLLINEYKSLESSLEEKKGVVSLYENYQKTKEKISKNEKDILKCSNEKLLFKSKLEIHERNLKELERHITEYHSQKENIEKNRTLESTIEKMTKRVSLLNNMISEKSKDLTSLKILISSLNKEIEMKLEKKSKISALEKSVWAEKAYSLSVSRDGIPFELISKAVPILEKEVNQILSQIVEFGVSIKTDGKNVITDIVYSDNSWPLELSSGLEKFLTSLALRVALINISNLPRPNFIAVDEGFGCADGENLPSMNTLFSILKSNFDFMLIISHLDSLKDMVDSTIEIKKENGLSKISN